MLTALIMDKVRGSKDRYGMALNRLSTHSAVPAGAVLRDVQVRVDVLQVPVEAVALQPFPEQHPMGDVPVRFLQSGGGVYALKMRWIGLGWMHVTE